MRPDTKCDRRQMMRAGLSMAVLQAGTMLAQTTALAQAASAPAGLPPDPSKATPLAADPELEARVMDVAKELRCLVCQNETLAASQSDLAQDLRKQIRLKLQQGQSGPQIVDFMVARYGDFVRYRPAFKGVTLLLWIGPFACLLAALAGLGIVIRLRRLAPPAALSEAELARARALLDTPPDAPHPPPSTTALSSSSPTVP